MPLFPCVLAVVLVTLLLRTAVAEAASSLSCGAWNVVSTPNTGLSYTRFNGVAAISANNIWAVGVQATPNYQTFTEHWNGTQWQVVSSPNVGPTGSWLNGVAAISASNVWAVGFYENFGPNQGLIEHWNGTKWQVVSSPNVGATLTGVAVVSATNVWAVGYNNTSTGLIEHWNGKSWNVVTSPSMGIAAYLYAVTVVSSSNFWAVGSYSPDSSSTLTLIEHWNGLKWSIVSSPNPVPSNDGLDAIAAVSSNNVWAVGANNLDGEPLIEHWDGLQWNIDTSPNTGGGSDLYGVTTVSSTAIWAVGYSSASNPNRLQTLIEHWNGINWSIIASPNLSGDNFLFSVTRVLGTNKVWAVGQNRNNAGPSYALTEFYC